ncbi:DUF4136 domain-containing protein [Poritiphilus flavus]|uniref:DUF4136 domain-containing protein n=1 Tax=Poritiphilus flavus TaxID=2697053 RepID=A0A6L9EHN9_9FLAO|nr:DUF4136 domain-containing protein [Poritiphilus flavus]NAS14172.1 DUF4136 domain-containing protein [Poritiphilus flavus]
MRYLTVGFLLIFCLSCTAVRVNYDYDKKTDFTNYTTYNYYPQMDTGLSQLDAKRLLKAVDSTMQMKGILFSEEPDFFINIQSRAFRTPQNSSVGVGVGGTGRNVGGGVSIGLPVGRPNMELEIVFDLVDSQKDELFWQAVSESAFRENASPSVKEQNLRNLVAKVFAKYPPKTK